MVFVIKRSHKCCKEGGDFTLLPFDNFLIYSSPIAVRISILAWLFDFLRDDTTEMDPKT